MIRLLWILTSAISLYGVAYYKREGYLPGASRAPQNATLIDPDKEAFSTAPHDDEYAPVHHVDDHDVIHDSEQSEYGGAGPSNSQLGGSQGSRYDGGYGGGYVQPSVMDENTGYSGAGGSMGSSNGRAQFPDARYEHV